jgi:predicted transcriptional regulator
MTPNDIKINLIRIGVSQADIARELEVSRAYVYNIIHGFGQFDKNTNRVWLKLKNLGVV